MGVTSAVRWWDEWQLLVLALASLTIQYFLAFFAGARKFFIPSWYRFVIWLSFVASDVVAIYALATLFNRQKKMDRDLELFWAPILLIHLGGQLSITAYQLEDNDQWKQYIITVPSQVAVAFYSFYKSWPLSAADKRLSAAAILLFVVGIIKCVLKPWALKSASFNSLASSFKSAERTTTTSRESELANYVQDAKTFFQQAHGNPPPSLSQQGFTNPERLFLDYAHPYADRLGDLRNFWVLDKEAAYKSITGELSGIFDLLYTRVREDGTLVRRMARTSAASLIVGVALILFHKSRKVAYSGNDIAATFVLLWGTFVLELTSSLLAVQIKKVTSIFFSCSVLQQASILADVASDKKFLKQCDSSKDITSLVQEHVKEGWKSYITDAESYRRFNDLRGQWTLDREGCDDQDLRWSLERPFGESITLWHVATAFCFHTMATSPAHEYARQSMEISNYMMHLFLKEPEMLIAGNTTSLPAAVYHQAENIRFEITRTIRPRQPDTKKITELLTNHLKEKEQELSGKFILYAFKLFSHLRDLGDEEKIWKVIKGVWVEILCFSASRGRGFMHARALGTGGEYLSIVWLLLARAGMETYPDRLHRTTKAQWTEEMRKNYLQKEEEIDGPIPAGSATSASPAAKVD